MTRRSKVNDYSLPGMYHITLQTNGALGHPCGQVVGNADLPEGNPDAPHVELSALGQMVEWELTHSISRHYSMVEIQDHIVMPEHLHVIIEVHAPIGTANGKPSHLGQVIAGFKKGCNRCYWEMTGQAGAEWQREAQRGKPADTNASEEAGTAGTEGYKVPSRLSTGRTPLFEEGYVDVMPLKAGQLATQRQYIRNNPRTRLLRSTMRSVLQTQRGGIDTALTVNALMGYLRKVCTPKQMSEERQAWLKSRLLTTADGYIACDSFGDRRLLGALCKASEENPQARNQQTGSGENPQARRLLPVVCHQKDAGLFEQQKAACLKAAEEGAVLVSPRISPREQAIMDESVNHGFPVIILSDNGMPERYHPSAERLQRCEQGKLLLITCWQYHYRKADEDINVTECKAMNCVAQSLCRRSDDWWKV